MNQPGEKGKVGNKEKVPVSRFKPRDNFPITFFQKRAKIKENKETKKPTTNTGMEKKRARGGGAFIRAKVCPTEEKKP